MVHWKGKNRRNEIMKEKEIKYQRNYRIIDRSDPADQCNCIQAQSIKADQTKKIKSKRD